MPRFVLSRRTMLRGAGGVALGLPPLEIMTRPGTANAATAPKRFVMTYAGSSLGGERGASMGANAINTPSSTGPDYQPTVAFQPLSDPAIAVKSEVTIVSGLKVPWGSTPPTPAGRPVNFHSYTTIPQTTGRTVQKNLTDNATGPSADQILVDTLAGTTLQKSMVLKVQPVNYLGAASGQRGRISFDKAGRRMEPIGSPHAVYDALFSGFTAPVSGTDPIKPIAPTAPPPDLVRRKSIMDLVRSETERLLPRLGRFDRERMDKHLEQIRDIERQIALLSTTGGGSTVATSKCAKPADFTDPPIESNSKPGYNNEELRAKLLTDLIHMSFACDRTRIVSLVYTFAQCYMSCSKIVPSGNGSDLHEIGHGAGTVADQAYAVAWHVKHFGNLVAKLRATPDLDGKTLLDNTVLLLLFEGGWGFDPEGNRMWSAHSTERMAVLVGGGRAGGIKHKGHMVAQDKHPAQVVLAGMNATGYQGALGEITTGLPELFA